MKLRFNSIKLYWWKDVSLGSNGNFGDEISKYIISDIFKRRVKWASPNECDLIGAGSLLSEVASLKGTNRPHVWTSGFIEDDLLTLDDQDFQFSAVRGKMTLSRIRSTSQIVVGDAGLLANYLIKNDAQKKYKLGIIPHYVDKDNEIVKSLSSQEGVLLINPTDDCIKVIRDISSCENIISSSLHGLIVADSLGIPNLHIKLSEKLKGGVYKFTDYYSVFSEERYSAVTAEILVNKDIEMIVSIILSKYIIPKDIEVIKNNILSAFPKI